MKTKNFLVYLELNVVISHQSDSLTSKISSSDPNRVGSQTDKRVYWGLLPYRRLRGGLWHCLCPHGLYNLPYSYFVIQLLWLLYIPWSIVVWLLSSLYSLTTLRSCRGLRVLLNRHFPVWLDTSLCVVGTSTVHLPHREETVCTVSPSTLSSYTSYRNNPPQWEKS